MKSNKKKKERFRMIGGIAMIVRNVKKEEEIVFIKPSMEYEKQAINLIEEVEKVDTDEKIRYSGFSSLQDYKDNYEQWLEKIEIYTKKETLPEGKVISNVFFSVRKKDNKLIGIISIRHELNDYLYNYGGHIGYSILPSERRKGYAYKQLLLGLDYCKSININRVLITCLDYNIGSSKTIEKAEGKLENIVKNEKENKTYKRYWISLKKRYVDRYVGNKALNTDLKILPVQDEYFNGDVYFYNFHKVKDKMTIPNGKSIMDNNYKWLEFYDYSSRIKLTAIYDDRNKIVEWYFDIAREIGKDNGIPYEDDMYLDVVVTPEGDVILLDEDEFKEAYDKKEMTKAEFDEAYKIAYELIERLKNNKEKLQQYTDKYLNSFLKG